MLNIDVVTQKKTHTLVIGQKILYIVTNSLFLCSPPNNYIYAFVPHSFQVWERLRGGLDGNGHRNTTCPTGIHPRGMCSCGSFLMTEESSARASISRIVMLAEALFEVIFCPQASVSPSPRD